MKNPMNEKIQLVEVGIADKKEMVAKDGMNFPNKGQGIKRIDKMLQK